ncbi:MAG: fumarate hydratase [Candidatus Coatesbacteria bacterium]|nr:fumarate hydratase [Candidatus Coatesbacteria bacterium]
MQNDLTAQVFELIRSASVDLSPDVEKALIAARDKETEGSTERGTFDVILQNNKMARDNNTPICQDTGTLIFYIDIPRKTDTMPIEEAIKEAARQATKNFLLRPNAVDPITQKNTKNNVGEKAPYIHFEQWDKDYFRYKLMLKGGGSENVGTQYTLPNTPLNAGRDINGIKKCVVDAVFQAQGKGCSPGIIGIGIGGDRCVSYLTSKEQFFRKFGERSPDPVLAEMEIDLYNTLNKLGIGPMGFGGKTTVLEVFAAKACRHPASFFVSISYMCWACRRKTMIIKNGEVQYD